MMRCVVVAPRVGEVCNQQDLLPLVRKYSVGTRCMTCDGVVLRRSGALEVKGLMQ